MAQDLQGLRPLERRILRLAEAGQDEAEIGRRFHRSPDHIRRVLELARLPGRRALGASSGLRPLERLVMRWREQGIDYPELGARFRRSPDHLRRVETLARHKLG